MTSSLRSIARLRWPRAESIAGDGPYALLSHYNLLTVSLWQTLEDAQASKALIDRFGCEDTGCHQLHVITEIEMRKA